MKDEKVIEKAKQYLICCQNQIRDAEQREDQFSLSAWTENLDMWKTIIERFSVNSTTKIKGRRRRRRKR